MSSENIETLQRFYDEFNRSGRADLEIFDNEVVWHQPDEIAGGMGTYHGHGGVRQAIGEMQATFDQFRAVPEEFIEAGDGRVVVSARHAGVGRRSGAPFDESVGHVWTFRDGKVIEWRAYLDPATALRAAGLSD